MRSAFEHHTWRWEARTELIAREIERIERELMACGAEDEDPATARLLQRAAEMRRQLIALGPCPRPRMG